MADTPTAYPLAWPDGWPRTQGRAKGPYRSPLGTAINNLRRELKGLCGERAANTLLLSSNVTLGSEAPKDPGVVAYFTWEQEAMAIPCDRWWTVEQNVQAIALTIETMRAMERHGAKHMIKAMFRGFVALPAPERWADVLFPRGAPDPMTLETAETAYKRHAREAHPDQPGGSHEKMARLNDAIARARKELA